MNLQGTIEHGLYALSIEEASGWGCYSSSHSESASPECDEHRKAMRAVLGGLATEQSRRIEVHCPESGAWHSYVVDVIEPDYEELDAVHYAALAVSK